MEFLRIEMTNLPLPNVAVSVQTDLPDDCNDLPGPEWMAAAIRSGLAQVLEPNAVGQVSLLIAADATVRKLNREYRGLDETTDVLSFSAEHGGHWEGDDGSLAELYGQGFLDSRFRGNDGVDEGEGEVLRQAQDERIELPFPIPEDEPPPLGDIVVSLPQAARQAGEQGVPLCRELALLLVHGALHLMGHDHYDEGERAEMQRLERLALEAFSSESGFTGFEDSQD